MSSSVNHQTPTPVVAPPSTSTSRLRRLVTPAAALLVALAAVLAAPSPAQAATVDRYELTDVTLDDGATATGWLEAVGGGQVRDFEITVEGGNVDAFPPTTYSSEGGDTGALDNPFADGPGFTVSSSDQRGRRLQLYGAESQTPDGTRIVTIDSTNSYECQNCSPVRFASGTVTLSSTTDVVAPEVALGPGGGCTADAAFFEGRVNDEDTPLSEVTVSASSDDPSVATAEIVGRSGADANKFEVLVTPQGPGEVNIVVNAGDGFSQTSTSILVTVGTAADDGFLLSPARDMVFGFGGDDVLAGGRGNDLLCGGGGDDQLRGGAGADLLFGGAGADRMSGLGGGDRLEGGTGKDDLRGNAGNDGLFGRGGNDRLIGGADRDFFDGGSGKNTLVDVGPEDATADDAPA